MSPLKAAAPVLQVNGTQLNATQLMNFEAAGASNFGGLPTNYQPLSALGITITDSNLGTYNQGPDHTTGGYGNGFNVFPLSSSAAMVITFSQSVSLPSMWLTNYTGSTGTITVTAYNSEAGGGGAVLGSRTFTPSSHPSGSGYVWGQFTGLNDAAFNGAIRRLEIFGPADAYAQLDDLTVSISSVDTSVTGAEGSILTRTGTFSDADGNGTVTLTASVGTITKDDAAGTWSWSHTAPDGPSGPTTVTLTATDSTSQAVIRTFVFSSTNAAPTATNQSVSVSINTPRVITVTATDPAGSADALSFGLVANSLTPTNAGTLGSLTGGQVTFSPATDYTGSASFQFTATDKDGASSTGTVQLNVQGGLKEIQLRGNNVPIADDDLQPALADHTDFGGIEVVSGTLSRTFTILNSGVEPLHLTGSPKVTIGGAHAADFTVQTQPPTGTVSPGAITTFTVTFDPSAVGVRSAILTIQSDDDDESSYDFAIQGTGFVPDLVVEMPPGTDLGSAVGTANLGTAAIWGMGAPKTITLRNTGATALTGIAVSKSGAQAGNFSTDTTGMATTLAPGATTTFQVRQTPQMAGSLTCAVNISSNDPDENPYVLTVSGSSLTLAEMAQKASLTGTNTEAIDGFGYSVAVGGDTVILGAPYEDSSSAGVNGDEVFDDLTESGAAYIFVRNPATGQWTQQAYLKASNPRGDDRFGSSVAISGDTVVVGAPQEDANNLGQVGFSNWNIGAAYVFVRNGTQWTQQAYLKASNYGLADFFGSSVAISGDTVLVSAPREDSAATGVNGAEANESATDSGACYAFVRSGTTWSQQAYLKASNTGAGDNFGGAFGGRAVAISGNLAVIGAVGEDSNATGINGDGSNNSASDSGAAYVFVRNGSTWSQEAYLKASNAESSDGFGGAVAISGTTAVVTASNEGSSASGINGNQSDNTRPGSGAAYVFVRSGTSWSQEAYVKASNPDYSDSFGLSAALSGDLLVIGAPAEASSASGVNGNQSNNNAIRSGAAYAFRRNGTSWTQQAYLKASPSVAEQRFGGAVSASGSTVFAEGNVFRIPAAAAAPTVSTQAADGLAIDGATLHAAINPNSAGTRAWFEYGATTGYGSTVDIPPLSPSDGDLVQSVAANITGLLPITTYHFRVVAENALGTTTGTDLTFTTTDAPEIVVEQPSGTGLSDGSATVNLGVTAIGATSAAKVFTIRNSGTGTLTGVVVSKDGANGGDFSVNTAGMSASLAPGASTTFSVGFSPTAGGTRTAALHISSNDGNENPFDIALTGRAPYVMAWSSAASAPITSNGFDASGHTITLSLSFAPAVGTQLTVVNNTGLGFIGGTFTNLVQGQTVILGYAGTLYAFVADYFGGTGNDLVLVWASNNLYAWGDGSSGKLGIGSTNSPYLPTPVLKKLALDGKIVTASATGGGRCLAVTSDGTVVQWGNSVFVPTKVTFSAAFAGKTAVAVACGYSHSMVLFSDGTVATWGSNVYGELGDGTNNNSTTAPVLVNRTGVLAGRSVVAIASGGYHCLALCSDGSLVAWGYGSNGILGNGSTANSSVPVLVNRSGVLAGKTVTSISAGFVHNVVLCSDGTVSSWGYNSDGRLGDSTTSDRSVPVLVSTSGVLAGRVVTRVTAGDNHSMALCSDGTVAAWGANGSGQLGNGTATDSAVPVLANQSGVLAGKSVVEISAGSQCSAARCADGTLATWGLNDDGQLGNGTQTGSLEPVLVDRSGVLAGKTVASLTAGEGSCLARCDDGTMAAWGKSNAGLLGNGQTITYSPPQTVPVRVATSSVIVARTVLSATAGAAHSLARLADGTLSAWGNNYAGVLGSGQPSDTSYMIPQLVDQTGVLAGKTVVATSAGAYHSLVLCSDGSIAAWGYAFSGQLGQGNTNSSSVPLLVPRTPELSSAPAVAIAAGGSHNLALLANGRVIAWGDNTYGQVAYGGATPTLVSMGALVGKTVKAIAAGQYHSLALCTDGTMAAWGLGNSGQLGTFSYSNSNVPVNVYTTTGALAGRTVVAIAAGRNHSLALCSDGTLAAWGANDAGQLGDGTYNNSSVPVVVNPNNRLTGKTIASISARDSISYIRCTDGTLLFCGGFATLLDTISTATLGAGETFTGGVFTGSSAGHAFAISGTPYTPYVPELVVEQPVGSELAVGAARHLGSVALGSSSGSLVFTVRNTGTSALAIAGITLTGGNTADFTVNTTGTASSVAIGASTTFAVTFTPTLKGVRTTTLRLVSDDPDESPFDIALTGTGISDPEIAVKGNGVEIADGDTTPSTADHTDFGNVAVSSGPVSRTFTIANTGTTPLNLTGTPKVTVSGAAFTVTAQPDSPVAIPTGTTTFVISFAPSAAGLHSATVTIASDDSDEGSYDFAIQGTGTVPDIAIEQPTGTELTSTTVNYGLVKQGNSASKVFTLRNTGTSLLTVSSIAMTGGNASDFAPSISSVSGGIAPGGSANVQVVFTPGSSGMRSSTLRITSDDPDESPYDIMLTGLGNTNPVLALPDSPVIAEATSASGAAVTFSVTANDAEDGGLTPSVSRTSGSVFALGETTVNVSVTDSAGASATGSFIVRVRDTTAPVVTPPANQTVAASSTAGAVVTFPVATALDAVGVTSLTYSPANGSTFPIGSTTVTVTAKDAANNTGTATFTVTVNNLLAGKLAFGSGSFTFNEEAGVVNVPIVRTNGSAGAVSVQVSTTNGTATAPADFAALSSFVVPFAPGETSKNVQVSLVADALSETNETFTISLAAPAGGAALGTLTTATVRILDPDTTKPTVTITAPAAAARVNEGEVNVTGTAADNKGVAMVEVSLNGGAYAAATATLAANGLSASYTAPLSPVPGANTVAVRSYDTRGNVSDAVIRSFTYVAMRPFNLTLTPTAGGTVTVNPALVAGKAQVGTNYTLTAAAKTGYAWGGWTAPGVSGEAAAATVLNVVMPSGDAGISVTATFLDTSIPTVTITTPAAAAKVPEGEVLIKGAAADNGGVARVEVSLNGGAFAVADTTLAASGLTGAYSATVSPVPGANTVAVRSYDTSGNVSSTVTRAFTYVVFKPITVTNTGGTLTFSPALAAGPTAQIGVIYTVTAKANADYFFNSWSGATTGTATTSSFTFHDGDAVTANFAASPFTSAIAGTYNGAIKGSTGYDTQTNAGIFSAIVTLNTGAFTGKMILDGVSSPLAGVFNRITKAFDVSAGATGFTYHLELDTVNAVISGTITQKRKGTTVAALAFTAPQGYSALVPPAAPGVYNVAFTAPSYAGSVLDADEYPTGNGFGILTVGATGAATFSGTLADGMAFTGASILCQNNTLPVYASFAGRAGAIVGTGNVGATVTATGIRWFRSQSRGQFYPFGYDTGLSTNLVGALRADSLSGSASVVHLTGPVTFDNAVTAGTAAGNYISADKRTTVTFAATTGLITGSYGTATTGGVYPIKGILVGSTAYGFILTPTPLHTDGLGEGGRVTITP